MMRAIDRTAIAARRLDRGEILTPISALLRRYVWAVPLGLVLFLALRALEAVFPSLGAPARPIERFEIDGIEQDLSDPPGYVAWVPAGDRAFRRLAPGTRLELELKRSIARERRPIARLNLCATRNNGQKCSSYASYKIRPAPASELDPMRAHPPTDVYYVVGP